MVFLIDERKKDKEISSMSRKNFISNVNKKIYLQLAVLVLHKKSKY